MIQTPIVSVRYINAMPEAPDLEVIKDYLNENLRDANVESCKLLRPTVVRSLAAEITGDLPGRAFLDAQRRGKFLTLRFSGGRSLVINPMLTGALQHCQRSEEHTSELQSRRNVVCRPLLEKKKNHTTHA